MTTMIAELYDALIAAGSPEEKARSAAEAMAGYEAYEQRLVRIEADIGELKRDLAEVKRIVSGVEQRVSDVDQRLSGQLSGLKGDVLLLKWMIGFVLLFQLTIFAKLFLH